ncbi:MAG: hypothetical protein ABIH23_24395, partial [bacterium]
HLMKTDINFKSYGGEHGIIITPSTWLNPKNPLDYDDVLKCSDCHGVTIDAITIQGGRENCFDAVRGSNYLLQNVKLCPNGSGGIVFKGAIDGWALDNLYFHAHGKSSDIEIGQFSKWWQPGDPPTRKGLIRWVTSNDGKPVEVWLWDAEMPQITQSNVRVHRVPWIVWFPYFLWRYFWTMRNWA